MNDRFLRACRRQPVDATPVWFMRQAGRYMSEYRALRERYTLLDLCRTPELATEVTLQPVRRFDVDAAILFSDLLLPLEPMGLPFDFIKGRRPADRAPVAVGGGHRRAVGRSSRAKRWRHVLQAIRQIQAELEGLVPLIGFAGAPFTLASYAIEGGHSTNFAHTKSLMYGNPQAWHRLCGLFAETSASTWSRRSRRGSDVVQLFDSWVGALNPARLPRVRPAPHPARSSRPARKRPGCRPFISASGTPPSCRRCARPAATWSAPTGASRWTRRGTGSATTARFRATSTRPCCSGRADRLLAPPTTCWRGPAAGPATSSTSGTAILPATPLEHVQALAHHVHAYAGRS